MSSSYSNIHLDVTESVATLTIDRPEVKNALNRETVNECVAALSSLAAGDEAGVLIITGAGESSFVSGSDIGEIQTRTRNDGLAGIASSLCAAVERFPRPTIAAINGYALGGGWSWRWRAISGSPRRLRNSASRSSASALSPPPAAHSACRALSASAGRSI